MAQQFSPIFQSAIHDVARNGVEGGRLGHDDARIFPTHFELNFFDAGRVNAQRWRMSSGSTAEPLHERRLVLLDQLHERHQPVAIRRAGRRIEINQRRDGRQRFAVFLFVLDAMHGHGSPPEKMLPLYCPAAVGI
jgi:hypothetical protein